jgi:Tol biopolymer transport system component
VIAHRHESAAGILWLTDLNRATTSRFTLTTSHDRVAVWSRDGTKVIFSSNRDNRDGIYLKAANGSGDEKQLVKAEQGELLFPGDWSSDGQWLAYSVGTAAASAQIRLIPLAGDQKPKPLPISTGSGAQFSPDGKYVAYLSGESKRFEIYLQSLLPGGGKWQISNTGGYYPRWKRDGSELYYLAFDSAMMAVPINLKGATPVISAPQRLFATRAAITPEGFPYAVTADGSRFLIANLPEQQASTVTVVLNWLSGLPAR